MKKRRPRRVDILFLGIIALLGMVAMKLSVDNTELKQRLQNAQVTVILPNRKLTAVEIEQFERGGW